MTAYPLRMAGGFGSPYSIKMRAVLRYRHIPFQWIPRGSKWDDLPEVKVPIVPAVAFPDQDGNYPGPAIVDSSPLIDRLEELCSGRSLTPADPVVEFLDRLIEDFGDEWMTKAMFHYRWHHPYKDAIDKAGSLLPLARNLALDQEQFERSKQMITERQISRTPMVGSTDQNRPVIESSFRRVLKIQSEHLKQQLFCFGDRPGRGDFGLFGQLSQLCKWEPEASKEAFTIAPRVCVWVDYMDDLSWLPVEDDAFVSRDAMAPTILELLGEAGVTYAPFLLANDEANRTGSDVVEFQSPDGTYAQAPFKYQVKCLQWLREGYQALSPADRADVDRLIAGTGCERLFVDI